MEVILDVAIKAVVTTAAGGIVTAVVFLIKNLIAKERVMASAVKALAHDSFYRQCRYLLAKDYITKDELENLNYLHGAYTSLGMNGTGEELYRRCLEKELK
ncbi:MAG: hypothetical protein HUJ76_02900 [Parasporobacterium sp.]|nr:hypothetical protein [Parasporobacterium sp.]